MRRHLLLSSAIALSTPAFAQSPPPVPDTVVTATRIPTPLDRVPAAVTVITRQDIEERGYRTLAEALVSVPGVRLVQGGGFGQQASAFVRGAASRQVLVLLDGVPLNDPSEPNGAFNFGNELLGDIERIEVVRGPASSLYGSGAVGGVVNMITRRAPANTPAQVFGEAGFGSERTVSGNIGGAGTTDRWNWLLMGQGISSRGFNVTPPRLATNIGEADGFNGQAATARLGFRPNAQSLVQGLLRWRQNNVSLDSVPYDDPNNRLTDRMTYGQLQAETTLGGVWTTGLRASFVGANRRNLNPADDAQFAPADDIYRGNRQSYEWANILRLGDAGPFGGIAVNFGVIQSLETADSRAGDLPFQTTTDASQRATTYNIGIQARLLDRIELQAGISQEQAQGYDGFTAWRLGANIAIPEINSRVIAAAGTAYKAPSLFQRYGVIGTFFRGNPNLRPEDSFSWEVGIETDIPAFGNSGFATAGATWFRSSFNNLINFNAAFDTLENIDKATSQGAELYLTLRPWRWLELYGGWTITEAKDGDGNPLPRRPRNVVTANARLAFDRFVIVPEVLFTGPSPEGPFASYLDDGTSVSGYAYNKSGAVLNLTATYRVTDQVSVFAQGRNLGGSRFEPANGFAVPGRAAYAGVRFAF
ncbi:TonB-dependent receptor plug domain-containing protein [Falsiroseomonas sp. HW251]|uniref:TonB-dependent receptor plug domain-containing protein n=1 Tax=Falsiroseomonas sp. HW251 TaxID=3390998 RepID=UPI003D31FE85